MATQNLPAYLNSPVIKDGLQERLGTKAEAFRSAMLTVWNNNTLLQKCDSKSIVGAAVLAATLNLSITPELGQAYIVPFREKATLQLGTKGLIQLAHRTGRYVRLHAGKVYEGEFRGFNPLTGEPERGERTSDNVVGYVAYMRLVNGFEATCYMTLNEIEEHALKYSQSYAYDKRSGKKSSPWTTNFDAMASKTVLKKLLRNWGVLSVEMMTAIQADQAVVDKNTFTYVDNGGNVQSREGLYLSDVEPAMVDVETGEVVEEVNVESTHDDDARQSL